MKKVKLSEWHGANVKPVHVGVYEIKIVHRGNWYRRWDGKHWLTGGLNILFAENSETILDSNNPTFRARWRGILK